MAHIRLTQQQNQKIDYFLAQAEFLDPEQMLSDGCSFMTAGDVCRTVDLEPNHRNACIIGNMLKDLGHRNFMCRNREGRHGRFYLVRISL